MTAKPCRILLVEDSRPDAVVLQDMLVRGADGQVDIDWVRTLQEALARVEDDAAFDAILLDLSLPDSHGLQTITRLSAAAPAVPILVITGSTDEQIIADAVRRGAEDYLVKGQIDGRLMARAIRYAIDRKTLEKARRQMEAQVLEAQRLESLGVLAGGIAHDFNNILAGILGCADVALTRLPCSAPVRADIEEIRKAARRASDLVRQMLAYSGKGKFAVEPLSLPGIVEDMKGILAMSVSKKAALRYALPADLPAIEADASQIGQVIMNLVINASEALGDRSGTITISAGTLPCRTAQCECNGFGDLPEGPYVCLRVADTGCGMDQQAMVRVFEPFFTTKFAGRGLGLAAVHGIVRSHRGAIRVSSEPGQGTTFCVYLPASNKVPRPAAAPAVKRARPRGSGTVLVVDDDELVRKTSKVMFELAGFFVLTACDGEEAIRIFRECRADIVCVYLDLSMPKMGGEEVLGELRRIDPKVRVAIASGYSEFEVAHRFAGQDVLGFVQKPQSLDGIIEKLLAAIEHDRSYAVVHAS